MRWTKRSQNVCKDCGYTWYPRGKNLSRQCPNCGSGNVGVAGTGCVILIIIALVIGWAQSKFSDNPKTSSDSTPTQARSTPTATPRTLATPRPTYTTAPATTPGLIERATPTPLPSSAPPPSTRFTTVADAQREALRRYPELGVSGSRFNSAFLARHKQYQQERPDYFRDPSWPVTLAEETAKALNPK